MQLEIKRTSCPVCDSKKNKKIGQHNKYEILVCSDCGLRFSDPMQEPDRSFYKETYLYEHRASKNVSESDLKEETILGNWRFRTTLDDMLGKTKNPSSDKVLDIGCGEGSFLYVAGKKGFSVTGIDLDQRAIETASKKFRLKDVKVADFSNLDQKVQFNFITLFETLEHTADPKGLIEKISSHISPDGSVYISVPSFDRKPKLFDMEADFPPHHLTLWTKKALEILLTKAGFTQVGVIERPLSGEDLQVHLIWRVKRLVGKKGKSNLITKEQADYSHRSDLKRILASISLVIFEILATTFKLLGVSRGYTFLVIATKGQK